MAYSWSENTPVDSTGTARSPFATLYSNVRYNLQFMRRLTLTQADLANLPGIAYRYYNDENAFHIIMAYNGILDPITDLYPGATLNLFTKQSLDAYIASQKTPSSSTRQRTINI